jgi:hypothetical protein
MKNEYVLKFYKYLSGFKVTRQIHQDLNINVVRSTRNVTDTFVLFINIARYISKNHKEGIT